MRPIRMRACQQPAQIVLRLDRTLRSFSITLLETVIIEFRRRPRLGRRNGLLFPLSAKVRLMDFQ